MVNPTPSGHFLVAILARFPQRAFPNESSYLLTVYKGTTFFDDLQVFWQKITD